jgi:hypothetical protein
VSAQYPGIRIVQGYPAHVVRHNAFEAVGYAVKKIVETEMRDNSVVDF